jgi:cysteine synthase A
VERETAEGGAAIQLSARDSRIPARVQCDRAWVREAIEKIEADFTRSADTHLIRLALKAFPDIPLYLKDESTHPSGSLKHRLGRSLFLYGLCNGWIGPDTPIVECSSGSTAISEAYFARLLGLRFIAVVPESISPKKIELIEFYGGECHFAPPCEVYDEAEKLASRLGGAYLDQFTFAERATDWRGNNNIAESLFSQFAREPHPAPDWVVVGAGTGGTSATIGRYIRYNPELLQTTRLCVVDPEHSVFFDAFMSGHRDVASEKPSRIEGIGRQRVEPSFLPGVIDRMVRVPDAASVATVRWLEQKLGRRCGGSTGTNVFGALSLMDEMRAAGHSGAVATMICDGGDRYAHTYYNDDWVASEGLYLAGHGKWLADITGEGSVR